jgi:hypothetical protein
MYIASKKEIWFLLIWYAIQTFIFLPCPFYGQVGKEHEELNRKISLLEKGSNLCTKFDASIAETLSLFEDDSVQKSFQGNHRIFIGS